MIQMVTQYDIKLVFVQKITDLLAVVIIIIIIIIIIINRFV